MEIRKGEFFSLENKSNNDIIIRQAIINDLDSIAKVEEIYFPAAVAYDRSIKRSGTQRTYFDL